MSTAFNGFLAVASAVIEAADSQIDPAAAEAFYQRSISTAYYAVSHRITEDVSVLLVGQLEVYRQTAFRRPIGHRAFKGLRKDLVDQQQQADQAGLRDQHRVLGELMDLCADLLQLQDYRESADYAPCMNEPHTTAEEALRSSTLTLQTWAEIPENAKSLFAQSLLWHLEINKRVR